MKLGDALAFAGFGSNVYSWLAPFAGAITAVYAQTGTAPSGGGQAITVLKNAAPSYSGFVHQASLDTTVPTGQTVAVTTGALVTFAAGDLIKVVVTGQAGNIGQTGAGLTVNLAVASTATATSEAVSHAAGSKTVNVASAGLSSLDAGDMQVIGVSPVGAPGPVAAAIGQPAFKVNIPIRTNGTAGTFTYHVDALLSAGASS